MNFLFLKAINIYQCNMIRFYLYPDSSLTLINIRYFFLMVVGIFLTDFCFAMTELMIFGETFPHLLDWVNILAWNLVYLTLEKLNKTAKKEGLRARSDELAYLNALKWAKLWLIFIFSSQPLVTVYI
ncbi:hypothetical protein L0B53_19270 (plasmid) [Vibrio sp. SS-MA-C1-2]|uniref:hypothetical protein n=1 Tax=Vibrio sp. SS-MA-C1-2 TaxID=2908646 RepID=UPI001F35E52B|nr:hypothetical protein [Vibrio sp. SS-MA-C1-2]UJF20276.1 hypothetical protein L0B53_19270 [Vibrio sp. SS-MA-C1-2]